MKLNKMFSIMMVFVTTISINSQTKIKTEANADIVEYTTKEGLPTTNISKILQTNDGYIWLSGIEGTYRFNGYVYDEAGKEFGVPQMQNMYYDSTKNVIYFASPKKFIVFDGFKFKVYGDKEGYRINGLAGQLISLLEADSKGRIWIGSTTPYVDKKYNGGLTMFQNGKFTVYDSTTYPLDNAKDFIETPYGDLIFNSDGRNTQTKEGSYIALFKEGKFKKIDETEGVYLQNASIPNQDFITSIDKAGNTWLAFSGVNTFTGNNSTSGNNTSGVLMYDGNEFHQYPQLKDVLNSKTIPILVEYSKTLDELFLTTASPEPTLFNSSNKGILEFDDGRWKYSDFFQEVRFVKNLKTNKNITDFSYNFSYLIKANNYFPELLVFNSISQRLQVKSSKYPNQFYTNKNGKWIKYDSFSGNPNGEMKDGFLLNTNKGFGIYYPNNSKMLTERDGLLRTTAGILDLKPDRNGIVWISYSYSELPAYASLDNAGINIWDGKSLRRYTEKEGLKSDITFTSYQDTKFRVWLPTSKGITVAREIKNSDGNWLFKFNNIENTGREDYNVTNVIETKNGEIYTWQNYVRPKYGKMTKADFYLGKFDGNKFVEMKSPFSEADKSKKYQLISLREGLDGNLWIEGMFSDEIKSLTSVPSKILIYDGKNWSAPPESWNMPEDQLHYVGTLKNGMYFLTVGGFYNFNGNRFVNLSDSVDANADFRILKGASVAGTQTNIQSGDRLYIRLRNRGLVIFDGKHLNFYTKKDGLPSASISNPGVDQKGNVTFGFPSGALVVNGENFQAYYDDESVVTGGVYVAAKDINGNLLMFYNGTGLYVRSSENNSYPLKISSVSMDTSNFYYNYPGKLSHSQNSFVFNYAALNYKDPRQTNYEHFLEGYDKDWSRPSNLSFAQYQNLPPGDYIFRVKGITSNGVKTNEASYAFVIAPPFWKTWWAYTFYLFAIIVFLYSVRKFELNRQSKNVRIQESQLRAEAAELQAKATEAQAQVIQAENERKTKELEEARQLQLSMLPKELPKLPNLDIAVFMQTATEVGGDYYDYHIHLDGTFTIVLGDATGHGMQAGMMVSIMKSLFMSDRSNKELLPFYNNTNAAIKDMQLGRLMMALTSVQFEGSKIRSINAGMPPILLYDNNQNIIEELTAKNMPLGAMKSFPYTLEEKQLKMGDTLLLLSDGLPELQNGSGEMYGYERVRSEFSSVGENEPEEIVNHLKNSASQWVNGKDPDDDVTFVVIKVK